MLLILLLAVIGAIAVIRLLIENLWSPLELVSSYLMPYFLPKEVQSLSERFGPWAAVTGCTDGIGKQYAVELARRGMNVVLISRNPEKLHRVAKEIETAHQVKTKVIVADFSQGVEVYPRIERELGDIALGILVNNVGLNYECPALLCDESANKSWEVLTVNTGAVTMMTRMVLPGMVARGRGALVNLASGAGLQPLPLMTVYGATKAYIRSFTHAIREEYGPKGIYVQNVTPFFVSTKMNAFSERMLEGGLLVPDVESYTRSAVNLLGRVQDTTGYWSHGIQCAFTRLPPVWLRAKIGMRLNRQFREECLQTKAKTL